MRRARKRDLRWLQVLTMVSIFLLVAQALHSRFAMVNRFTFTIDHVLSESVRSNIIAFIEGNPEFKKLSPQLLADCLREHFLCVKSVAAQFLAPDVMHVEIAGFDPLFLLNQESVLTAQGSVLSADTFTSWRLRRAPMIAVKNQDMRTLSLALFREWAQQIPLNFFKKYDVCFFDTFHLEIQEKEQTHFSIVCDTQTVPTQQLLAQCTRLRDELEQCGAFRDKKAKHWIADIRFDKQIILFAEQEGGSIRG